MHREPDEDRRARLASIGLLAVLVASVQIFLAHRYFGFVAGDDVEVLEEAFRRAIGLAYQPWAIRNLFVADVVVAPVVRLAHVLGIDDRRTLIEAASLPFIALTIVTMAAVFRIAGIVAAALFALHWIPLGFGSTVYPRTLATACIVIAVLIVDRRPVLAGALLAVAFADRFSEIIFLVPLLIVARQRWRVLAGAAGGVLLLGGVYDWIAWGAPFRSLMNFARLTLVASDFASRVKYQSPLWYIGNVGRWCAPTLLILAWFGRRREPRWWLFVIIPAVALSLVRHKELRYMQAIIPFLAIGAAAGFAALWERGRRAVAVSLLAISVVWNLYEIHTFRRKSMPAVMAAQFIDRDDSIRAVAVPQAWALGGHLYFHRPLALHEVGTPPRALPPVDAAAMYETDLDQPALIASLRSAGLVPRQTFRDGPARAVVLFTRAASDISDRARR